MEVTAVEGSVFGAVVRGVSLLDAVDDAVWARIETAFNEHGLLIFPEQHGLSREAQVLQCPPATPYMTPNCRASLGMFRLHSRVGSASSSSTPCRSATAKYSTSLTASLRKH
jgi:alpha-ketoglutarate-dependent taurine dioxygenase